MRVEYCKALARSTRWNEEVSLLCEEMRRTLASLKQEAVTWRQRATLVDVTVWDEFNEGRRAYALKQAAYRDKMHAAFTQLWSGSGEPGEERSSAAMDANAQVRAGAQERETGVAAQDPETGVAEMEGEQDTEHAETNTEMRGMRSVGLPP